MSSSRVPPRALSNDPATGEIPINPRPYLDEEVLLSSQSQQVCITCQLHEGLISHGEHLSHRPPAETGVVRRFGLTHRLLRRTDPLD